MQAQNATVHGAGCDFNKLKSHPNQQLTSGIEKQQDKSYHSTHLPSGSRWRLRFFDALRLGL